MDKKEDELGIKLQYIADMLSHASHDEHIKFISYLRRRFNVSSRELKDLDETKEFSIPIGIFNDKLSCLESIVRYLKDQECLDVKRISSQLNRSVKTIWATYRNSLKKQNPKIILTKYSIPISLFKERKLSILETIVLFLKEEHDLNYPDIAKLLQRKYKIIWSIYQKAKKKNG